MKRSIFLAMWLLLITIGCRTNLKLTDQQSDNIVNEVKATSQQFWNLYNMPYTQASLAKIMSFVDKSEKQDWQDKPAQVVFNISIFPSWADLDSVWRGMITERASTNVIMLNNFFTVLSETTVLEVNDGYYTITGAEGDKIGPFEMVNTIVWINRSGKWKMLHFHESWAGQKE